LLVVGGSQGLQTSPARVGKNKGGQMAPQATSVKERERVWVCKDAPHGCA
jgi:hypothetical protein